MKKTVVFYNEQKDLARKIYQKSLIYFKERRVEVLPAEEISRADFVVSIGGDGTLLQSFREIIKNENLFVIAINAGSLGFLTEIREEGVFEIYDEYLSGDFKWEERHILEIRYRDKIRHALNELLISKDEAIAKVIRTKFSSDGEYMCVYKGDGVIVSTPTGSTAYSMSAGGPIVKSGLKVIIITPLAPHNLNTRPIVVGGEECLSLEMIDEGRTGTLLIDGHTSEVLLPFEKISVRYCEKTLRLIIPKHRNYYSVLREKLKWGDNLC